MLLFRSRLKELFNKIQLYGNQNRESLNSTISEPDIGAFCLVYYDEKYNRAIFEDFICDADKFCAKVKFIDFGDSAEVPIENILRIPDELINFLPPQVNFIHKMFNYLFCSNLTKRYSHFTGNSL